MSINIEKKLRTMTKSQLEEVCHKMKCPTGTKKEMVGHLLRPFGMKYKMDFMTLHDIMGGMERKIRTWDKETLSDWALTFQNITDERERELLVNMFLKELERRWERDENLKKTKRIFGSSEDPSYVVKLSPNPP